LALPLGLGIGLAGSANAAPPVWVSSDAVSVDENISTGSNVLTLNATDATSYAIVPAASDPQSLDR